VLKVVVLGVAAEVVGVPAAVQGGGVAEHPLQAAGDRVEQPPVDPEDFRAYGPRVGSPDGVGDVMVVAAQAEVFPARKYRDTIPSPIGTFSQ
jgi:hypothetical protein